jgi:HAD superfamily hydrolase (TIGR01549 family)
VTDAPEVPDRLPLVLGRARYVLLDFDGPVCDVFAGLPARDIAERLRELVMPHLTPTPADVVETDDPLHVLRRVGELAPSFGPAAHEALTVWEVEAVKSAEPTKGSVKLIRACRATGRPVAIVSNNATPAVVVYLDQHGLRDVVHSVHGREEDPRLMKPATYLLDSALAALGSKPEQAVMIGDSDTDIEAAQAAGVPIVAYANKPGKAERFAAADAVTDSMSRVAAVAESIS